MIVHVRLFARARDLAGADSVTVELPDGATVADLRRRLAAEHPALAGLLERSALAVENEFAEDLLSLSANAEIALLPPVSGGEGRGHPISNPAEATVIPRRRDR
jgi:molybdopterin synthase catalytic subunit